jgi:hypothetical protein
MRKRERTRHAEDEDARIERGFAERDFKAVGTALMTGLYKRALGLLEGESYVVQWAEPAAGYELMFGLLTALNQQIEREGDAAPARLLIAREAISAIADTQAILEGRDAECEDEGVRTAKLVICAARIGHADTIARLDENGLWDEFGEAKFKLHSIGSPRRNHRPQWEVQFLDEARRFISAMGSGATMGGLVRRAKTWAKEREKQGDSLEVPKTDDGIKAGIRRMRQRGEIILPKRGG